MHHGSTNKQTAGEQPGLEGRAQAGPDNGPDVTTHPGNATDGEILPDMRTARNPHGKRVRDPYGHVREETDGENLRNTQTPRTPDGNASTRKTYAQITTPMPEQTHRQPGGNKSTPSNPADSSGRTGDPLRGPEHSHGESAQPGTAIRPVPRRGRNGRPEIDGGTPTRTVNAWQTPSNKRDLEEGRNSQPSGTQKETTDNNKPAPNTRNATKTDEEEAQEVEHASAHESHLEEIERRLHASALEINWDKEVEDVMEAEGRKKKDSPDSDYMGDNMEEKAWNVGCRITTFNAQGKCNSRVGERYYLEDILDFMQVSKSDIMVITEPGAVQKIAPQLRRVAAARNYTALIKTEQATAAEGVIIIIGSAWSTVLDSDSYITGKGHSSARAVRVVFKEAGTQNHNKVLNKMAVYAVYGYANKTQRAESKALWKSIKEDMHKWRKEHKLSSTIMAGDINAAKWSALDTDRPDIAHKEQTEKDASTITWIESNTPLQDIFRTKHPQTKAVTRRPQGSKTLTEAARRIDQIWTSKEVSNHPSTRIGIRKHLVFTAKGGAVTATLQGDHLPVTADIPVDCAGLAEGTTPVWDPHKEKTMRMRPAEEVTDTDKTDYSMRFRWMHTLHRYKTITKLGKITLEDTASSLMKGLYEAAEGSIGEEQTKSYPKRVTGRPYRDGWGFKLDAWKERIIGACRAIYKKDRTLIKQQLENAVWTHEDIPLGIVMDKLENAWESWDRGDRKELKQRLTEQAEHIREHRTSEERKAKQERIAEAIKKRNDNFKDPTGKGKGKVIASIFRKTREYHDLKWLRRKDESLATAPDQVETEVRSFFSDWFKSRMPVENRWGSWQNMMRVDTEEVPEEYREFVRECYQEPMQENMKKADQNGMWEEVLDTITIQEVNAAINKSKAGTAAGPSQVGIDMIKALNDNAKKALLQFYNECKEARAIPDNINRALMRLLPKSDKGLANLNLVRPIALMENITKVYEHIMITRVVNTITEHNLIDMGQYGAVPMAGVAAPLRIMSEMMDDARVSGQELHIMVADLAKAFDTCEYWSQALSWRCLGVPEEMINLLINLDSGDLKGKGATTKVLMGSGRTTKAFRHGRGVRQGSVGGPIKWVVFVHYWIQWVKKKMKGEGYIMSANQQQRYIPEMIKDYQEKKQGERGPSQEQTVRFSSQAETQEKPSNLRGEINGMVFVDDSIWPTKNAGGMQKAIRLHETFCEFHKIFIHKNKSEYISINAEHTQVRWNPEKKLGLGHTEDDTIELDPVKRAREQQKQAMGIEFKQKQADCTRKKEGPEHKRNQNLKYLGVWFDTIWGWKTQRHKTETALKQELQYIREASIPLEVAIYCTNTKVIPKIAYPLQVAVIPAGTIEAWDRKIRAAVAKAGKLPRHLPQHMYYLSKE